MKLLKAECEVNEQEGGEEFKCYLIWQIMMATLHKRAAEDRDGWRRRERMLKTCRTTED